MRIRREKQRQNDMRVRAVVMSSILTSSVCIITLALVPTIGSSPPITITVDDDGPSVKYINSRGSL